MLDLGIQDQGLTESVVIKENANGLYSLWVALFLSPFT